MYHALTETAFEDQIITESREEKELTQLFVYSALSNTLIIPVGFILKMFEYNSIIPLIVFTMITVGLTITTYILLNHSINNRKYVFAPNSIITMNYQEVDPEVRDNITHLIASAVLEDNGEYSEYYVSNVSSLLTVLDNHVVNHELSMLDI